MVTANVQRERNEVLRLLDVKRKKHFSPEVQLNTGNTLQHEIKKLKIVWEHVRKGHSLVTEAYFLSGGRADAICLDCRTIYEAVVTEENDSLETKRLKYPKMLEFEVV